MGTSRRDFNLGLLGGVLAAPAFALGPRPKLLVLVVLEQVRQDYFDAAAGQFAPAGLRRILLKGAHYPDCRHLAATFPATTLATLATGAWPSQHGIVADGWFDRATRAAAHASREGLLATTLTAQVAAEPNARAFVIGMDEPQSALAAGTAEARRFWMAPNGRFSTLGEAPEWLNEFNTLNPIDKAHDSPWMAIGARPGAPPLRRLTFDPARPSQFFELFQASPLGQAAQFDFLARLIEKERLGQGDTFDFVCLVAGSMARLGYETGGRSPLMHQMVLHLDRQLEHLLTHLKAGPGDNGYTLVLVGAHGAPPAPAPENRVRMAVAGESLAQTVDRALQSAALGRVSRYLYPFLYLDTPPNADPEPARLAAGRAKSAGARCIRGNGW